MNTSKRYSPEVRERAVRMVLEHEEEYSSQWAAIESISEKFGCRSETLRRWVRQAERDSGRREGRTTGERERIKELEREWSSPDFVDTPLLRQRRCPDVRREEGVPGGVQA
jgi:transposase